VRGPALSVVLATPGPFESIARTLDCLARQTVADSLELIVVVPHADDLDRHPALFGPFRSQRVLEIGPFDSVAAGNAAGAAAATADLVAFAEDHSFPEPQWAAALIARHRGPWAAVGPVVRNANPATAVSWCDFLMGYGPFAEPHAGGEAPALPGHNSSYKRAALLGCGERLEELLEAEWVLHQELRASGERLFLEPRAVVSHVNFALPRSWLAASLWGARGFASTRAREWGRLRRAAYAMASPLIPFVRARRLLPRLRRMWRATRPPARVLPLLTVGLGIDALGQCAGYLAGAGTTTSGRGRMHEFHRLEHVPSADRRALRLEAR
jgi:hypothetical protein